MADPLDNMTVEQLREEIRKLREQARQHLTVEQQLQSLNDTLMQRTLEAEQRTEQLRVLANQLTQIENRERRRLALLLHDHLQQLLVGSRMKIGLLKQQVKTAPSSSALSEAADLIDQAISMSRSLSVDLSPPILYEAGLAAGLEWLAEQMETKHGLHVEADVTDDPEDKDIRIFIFQCVRELLFNVVKHAKTDSARVLINPLGEHLIQINVSDEGVGFDPSVLNSLWAVSDSFGLHSIHERLKLLGGEMSVTSEPGKGTTVTLTAPVYGAHVETDERS